MERRTLLQLAILSSWTRPLVAALRQSDFNAAADSLARANESGQIRAASLYVRQGSLEFNKSIGDCKSSRDMFLIASISKPMSVAGIMTLYQQGHFRLDDGVRKFIPEFTGDGRENITVRQLLTHVSGLPDQLPENGVLRARHAELGEFIQRAIRTPLLFAPGSQYSYSSMGILLASELAQRITGQPFHRFLHDSVFAPLGMQNSALGIGEFQLNELMRCQVEDAAPESGAGDPATRHWDWNSPYWRKLGSPWGGVHASSVDVAQFFDEFLRPGKVLKPEIARLMIRNHNPEGLTPRGLGFALGAGAFSPSCSDNTFGHGGATGTLAWADPISDTICVVLTTLPAQAVKPHPRQLASDRIAKSA